MGSGSSKKAKKKTEIENQEALPVHLREILESLQQQLTLLQINERINIITLGHVHAGKSATLNSITRIARGDFRRKFRPFFHTGSAAPHFGAPAAETRAFQTSNLKHLAPGSTQIPFNFIDMPHVPEELDEASKAWIRKILDGVECGSKLCDPATGLLEPCTAIPSQEANQIHGVLFVISLERLYSHATYCGELAKLGKFLAEESAVRGELPIWVVGTSLDVVEDEHPAEECIRKLKRILQTGNVRVLSNYTKAGLRDLETDETIIDLLGEMDEFMETRTDGLKSMRAPTVAAPPTAAPPTAAPPTPAPSPAPSPP